MTAVLAIGAAWNLYLTAVIYSGYHVLPNKLLAMDLITIALSVAVGYKLFTPPVSLEFSR